MRIAERLTRLVRADAHGLLDALEERSLVARQELREAELELLQKRARVRALTEAEERSREERDRIETELRALDEDASLALASGRDDLARFALRRVLARRKACTGLDARIAEIAAARERVSARLAEQESAFESLRVQVQARLARERAAAGAEECELSDGGGVSDEEVELELLRRRGTGPEVRS